MHFGRDHFPRQMTAKVQLWQSSFESSIFENMITKKNNCLILGVTGGIASGKTTVANMLCELGAAIIDFDILARQVVEPGTPGLRKIVGYFGNQVLRKDGTLDRKKLSAIVFQSPEKRKKLESFTHPAIHNAYVRQVRAIMEKTADGVIQAVIPLLFEFELQHTVDKVLVVYVSREKQIERLMQRDGITRTEAGNILSAQLPIDQKRAYADFVIWNENSVTNTREQVNALWDSLKKMVREYR